MTDLTSLTLAEARDRLKSRAMSSLEITKAHLEAIERGNSLNAFVAITADKALEMAEAMKALPLEQRTVLLLCVVEGFTCREAGEVLNVPIGTVMSRLSRARQELRNTLAPRVKAMQAKGAFL